MKRYISHKIEVCSSYIEMIIAFVIGITIIVSLVSLIGEIGLIAARPTDLGVFNQFLGHALNLVIGIEFIKMLCKHTPGSVIEVLLFAIARQMIVEHTTVFENLIGILAIAVLFAVRRYLYSRSFDELDQMMFPAWQKVLSVKNASNIYLPYPNDQSIGEALQNQLEKEGTPLKEGNFVALDGVILRISRIKNGAISRVEVQIENE